MMTLYLVETCEGYKMWYRTSTVQSSFTPEPQHKAASNRGGLRVWGSGERVDGSRE